MDKKIAGLLGAAAGLATVNAAQAATEPGANPSETLQASSYAELLAPIPNAVEVLKADNAARAQNIKLAQYYNPYYGYSYPPSGYYAYPYYRPHHHHHHHNNYYSRHDHHHHHNSAYIGIPGVGGVVVNGR
jgi:membrane-bound lytic murein transglycosylase